MRIINFFVFLLLLSGCAAVDSRHELSNGVRLSNNTLDTWNQLFRQAYIEKKKKNPDSTVTSQPVEVSKIVLPSLQNWSTQQTDVISKIVIDKKGDVENAYVLKSDDDRYNEVVVVALKQWKFKPPYLVDGYTEAGVVVPFRFHNQMIRRPQ